jgi:hypothetical protein
MWTLRKFYAGNGGCLPPTDERILRMTPEQIDLEFAHIAIDRKIANKASGAVSYEDDEYDAYDEETDTNDSRLSDMPVFESEIDPYRRQEKEGDWVDVETDDY